MYVSVLHCGSEGQRKLAPTQRLGPGFQVQVVRLGSRGIYSVNHLAGVCVCIHVQCECHSCVGKSRGQL